MLQNKLKRNVQDMHKVENALLMGLRVGVGGGWVVGESTPKVLEWPLPSPYPIAYFNF